MFGCSPLDVVYGTVVELFEVPSDCPYWTCSLGEPLWASSLFETAVCSTYIHATRQQLKFNLKLFEDSMSNRVLLGLLVVIDEG